jgi:hypothetical protein
MRWTRPSATAWLASLASLAVALAAPPARPEAIPSLEGRHGEAIPSPDADDSPGPAPRPSADPAAEGSRLRRWASLGGTAGVYVSATTYMYFAWYHGQPDLPSFRFGGDGWFGGRTYTGGADKLGHAWSSLALSRLTGEILIWGGWEPWQAGLLGSGMTLGLFTAFELKDAFYTEFSPGDALFNGLGGALAFAMLAYPPLDELVDFRVEYLPSREYRDLLAGRRPPEGPAGPRQVSLNFVEDYSGQRYLLALHLGALPPLRGRTWARLVDVAVGYETSGYMPAPIAPEVRRERHLFLGLAVNMQGLVELALAERTGALARRSRAAGRLVFELLNPPFGSWAVAGARGSPDR